MGTATKSSTLFENLCAIVCIFYKISVSQIINTCSFIIYAYFFFVLVCPLGYIGLIHLDANTQPLDNFIRINGITTSL